MRRIITVALSAVLATLVSPAAAHAAGPSIQDCPAPSFVRVSQSDSGGRTYPWTGYIDSREPGRTIHLSASNSSLFYVTHHGDVRPRTTAYFVYFDTGSGTPVDDHQTQPARDNGVIHQEPEVRRVESMVGRHVTVRAAWQDECGAGARDEFLGYVQVHP